MDKNFISQGATRRMPRPSARVARPTAFALVSDEEQTSVVQLHDAGDQAVNSECHDVSDRNQHADLDRECLVRHRAERDYDDLGRENEVGAERALDLVML
jgi:hypothetical protein